MQHIAAIQTRFKGYLFRSRLEARWAVFFDRCHERFVYEDQGFHLPSGPYLPDFYLARLNIFIEIKPASMLPTRNFEFGVCPIPIDDEFPLELNLIHELSKATCSGAVAVYGDPLDALAGGAVFTSKHGLLCGPVISYLFRNAEEAALISREARFEHGATPR
jgi:hypothetical protein